MAPYEIPQVVSQIPPPPMNVPMPIRKTLLVDRESSGKYLNIKYFPLLSLGYTFHTPLGSGHVQ